MSYLERPRLAWVILGLLVALVATNITFLMLSQSGGPLFGLAFYLFLLALTLRARQRDHRSLVIGGLVGLAVHVVEAVAIGWWEYPVLVVLNLVLPAALAISAWVTDHEARRVASES